MTGVQTCALPICFTFAMSGLDLSTSTSTFLLSTSKLRFDKLPISDGSTRFYFAEPSEMGNLSNLNFEVDSKK